MLAIPSAVKNGLSFQENFLLLSTNGMTANIAMKRVGMRMPAMNFGMNVLRNAYRLVRYHSGKVYPTFAVEVYCMPRETGYIPPSKSTAPVIAETAGISKVRLRGKWTSMRTIITIGRMKMWSA